VHLRCQPLSVGSSCWELRRLLRATHDCAPPHHATSYPLTLQHHICGAVQIIYRMQKCVLHVCAAALLVSSLLTDLYSSLREHVRLPSCGMYLQAYQNRTARTERWPQETHLCTSWFFVCLLIESDSFCDPTGHKNTHASGK